jgi:hypothetical protein
MVGDGAAEDETFRGRQVGRATRVVASAGDAGVAPTGHLAVCSTPRLLDSSTSSLPTALNVAHAPDGAHSVETRRLVVRVEADVLVRVPEMGFAGEEIFDLEWFPGV